MQAFHNSQEIKDKYVNRVNYHIEADHLIRGVGWSDGKGCAVGCTLENYKHSQYPIELGIPEWLARVEDTLFEGMSFEKSKIWPKFFLESINVGSNLENVKAPFLIMILKSVLKNFDNKKFKDVTTAVNSSISLWERIDIGSDEWKEAAARSARSAEAAAWSAWSARSAAWSAARSAAWSAARSAAWSAEAAARSARSAEAAEAAAWSAEAAKYDEFADNLIGIISSIK